MSTPLTRPVVRSVERPGRLPLTVRLGRSGVEVREYGRKKWLGPVSYGAILVQAAKAEANLAIAQRRGARR